MKRPIPKLALTVPEAAKALSISRKTLWKLTSTGKIRKTIYGVIPVAEIERHLREEVKA